MMRVDSVHFAVFHELKISFPLIEWFGHLVWLTNSYRRKILVQIPAVDVKSHTGTYHVPVGTCIVAFLPDDTVSSRHHWEGLRQTWEEWGVTWLAPELVPSEPLTAPTKTWGKWRCDRLESTRYREEEVLRLASTAFPSRSPSFAPIVICCRTSATITDRALRRVVPGKEETSMPDWQCRAGLNVLDRLRHFIDLTRIKL